MNTKNEIIKLENKLLEAIKISDVETLDHLLHNDLLFVTPQGQTVTKQMDLDAHRSGLMVVIDMQSTIDQINLIGNSAVVTVIYKTKGIMMGNPIEGNFKYIRIWNLFDDGFKVIGGSCMMV